MHCDCTDSVDVRAPDGEVRRYCVVTSMRLSGLHETFSGTMCNLSREAEKYSELPVLMKEL